MKEVSGRIIVMKKYNIVFIIFLLFFYSCTHAPLPQRPLMSDIEIVRLKNNRALIERLAPVFLIENPHVALNRIGTPKAVLNAANEETVFVDSSQATIYTETRDFTTLRGAYKNLIYRIHFKEVPLKIQPFYLGAGKNVGLIVIITVNAKNQPLLYTTVNTCGCYIAFIPTSYLPKQSFPGDWEKQRQSVFSENLPGFLKYKAVNKEKIMILLRHGSHRVKDIWIEEENKILNTNVIIADHQPLTFLEHLVRNDGQTTSFYETAGHRAGYVKSSQKIWERLLMSWWAMDWKVGEDKKLGRNKQDGPVFYTDLKPWARDASDMRDFKIFLEYWEWKL